jgi:alkylated DNA repair dioxygenase AlkB
MFRGAVLQCSTTSVLATTLDMFGNNVVQLLADVQGGIRYWQDFFAREQAEAWFERLRHGCDWQGERRKMYDRIVDVPRLLATYSTDALPAGLPLAEMLGQVRNVVPAPFNSVGLNFYRDGADSVAMHHDKLHTLVPGHPIALISLGDTRRMNLRAQDRSARSFAVDLEPGSLLVMSHASQLTHLHGIAKTKRLVGPRISVVFRVRPEQWRANY